MIFLKTKEKRKIQSKIYWAIARIKLHYQMHFGENAHEGVPAVTGTIKDWCESLIFYQ